jgi:type I restriction enzyme R subunit
MRFSDETRSKLSIYLRHLAPVIAESQLDHEIDLSTVDFDYIAQHKQDTTSGKPSGGTELQPVSESGTGTARDPELVALEEVIAQINDLFSGDHPDSSVRNVVTHIKDRLEESETLQEQAQNNTLAPELKQKLLGELVPLIYEELKDTA